MLPPCVTAQTSLDKGQWRRSRRSEAAGLVGSQALLVDGWLLTIVGLGLGDLEMLISEKDHRGFGPALFEQLLFVPAGDHLIGMWCLLSSRIHKRFWAPLK